MIKELMKFGLTEYEAKCYLSLLKLEKSSALELCKSTGIPDSRIYNVLASLEKKGFIKVEEGVPKKYIPCNPEKCIENAFQRIVDDLKRAKEVLKELKKIYHEKKPEIEIINGKNKILENLEEIISKEDYIKIAIYRRDQIPPTKLKEILKGKKVKVIVGDEKLKKYFPEAKVDSRHFLHGVIVITKKAILLTPPISTKKKIAYIGFNEDSISLAEKTFNHLWEEAK